MTSTSMPLQTLLCTLSQLDFNCPLLFYIFNFSDYATARIRLVVIILIVVHFLFVLYVSVYWPPIIGRYINTWCAVAAAATASHLIAILLLPFRFLCFIVIRIWFVQLERVKRDGNVAPFQHIILCCFVIFER